MNHKYFSNVNYINFIATYVYFSQKSSKLNIAYVNKCSAIMHANLN